MASSQRLFEGSSFNNRGKEAVEPLLLADDSQPANAFYMNGTGKVSEGMSISLRHPLTGNAPALLVGEYFILRHKVRGCLYRPMGDMGLVRRLEVEYLERDGKKPIGFLVRPEGSTKCYLHVDTSLLSDPTVTYKVTYKERFFAGTHHTGAVVAYHGNEELLCLNKEGDYVDVFYVDGSVKRVVCVNSTLKSVRLSIEEQAQVRIDDAMRKLSDATKLVCDGKAKRSDYALHQLAAVLAVGGKRSAAVFEKVFGLLKTFAEAGEIRLSVKEHVLKAVAQSLAHALVFNNTYEAARSKKTSSNESFGNIEAVSTLVSASEKALRAKDRAKREANRQENRNKRHTEQQPKGNSLATTTSNGNKKSKGKKG